MISVREMPPMTKIIIIGLLFLRSPSSGIELTFLRLKLWTFREVMDFFLDFESIEVELTKLPRLRKGLKYKSKSVSSPLKIDFFLIAKFLKKLIIYFQRLAKKFMYSNHMSSPIFFWGVLGRKWKSPRKNFCALGFFSLWRY